VKVWKMLFLLWGFLAFILVFSSCAKKPAQGANPLQAENREVEGFAQEELKDERGTQDLLAALQSENWQERLLAVEGLAKRKDKAATAVLLQAFEKEDNELTKARMAHALGEIGDKEAVPALINALESSPTIVQGRIVYALGKIGDKRAEAPLKGLLKTPDERLRVEVETALKRLR